MKQEILSLLMECFSAKAKLAGVKDFGPATSLESLRLDSADYVRALMLVRGKANPTVKAEGLIGLRPEATIQDLAALFSAS